MTRSNCSRAPLAPFPRTAGEAKIPRARRNGPLISSSAIAASDMKPSAAAASAAATSSRVLPMPGSPSSVSAVSRPALADASSCLIAPSSTCRPTTGPAARLTWRASGATADVGAGEQSARHSWRKGTSDGEDAEATGRAATCAGSPTDEPPPRLDRILEAMAPARAAICSATTSACCPSCLLRCRRLEPVERADANTEDAAGRPKLARPASQEAQGACRVPRCCRDLAAVVLVKGDFAL